jgi:hypothetical protein
MCPDMMSVHAAILHTHRRNFQVLGSNLPMTGEPWEKEALTVCVCV